MNVFTARWNQITRATEETAATWNAPTVAEQNAIDNRAAHIRAAANREQINEWRKLVRAN